MTIEEYKEAIKELEIKYKKNRNNINSYMAVANKKYCIGDVISSNTTTIKIDTIKWGFRFGADIPECAYRGHKLTKKLKPFKSGDRDIIYQSETIYHVKN